jgi:para-aminobenzoate synthetase component 1
VLPIVEEICPVPDVSDALRSLQSWPDVVLFESALRRDRLGRYSFLSADPIQTRTIDAPTFGIDPFKDCRELTTQFDIELIDELPPFQGGLAGFMSYELGGCWERVDLPRHDEFQMPAMFWGFYDWVLSWDHLTNRCWIISHGLGEFDSDKRNQRLIDLGAESADRHRKRRQTLKTNTLSVRMLAAAKRVEEVKAALKNSTVVAQTSVFPSKSGSQLRLVEQHALANHPGVTSDFSKDKYLSAVEQVIEYIEAGDIFQANLSQRLLARWQASPVELYCQLRECNAAPFAAFLAHDNWAIASSSPERFVRVKNREVQTRPIKGTRQRRSGPEADLFTRDELRASEKDVAENVMIVDLLRNDLSRVCEPGSISVPQLCTVESYETVQHLVSEIRGTLASNRLLDPRSSSNTEAGLPADEWSLFAATFPGGSITGAPKVRAMEIIAELEPTARGPYCGSMFYVGFDGTMDSNILIRTLVYRHGWVQCSVGGGIVAQSNPLAEYNETLHKAAGMLRVFDNSHG